MLSCNKVRVSHSFQDQLKEGNMNLNYQCPTEFNIPTSLLDCEGYSKRMQESTDQYKYKMAIRPGPMCMSSTQPFQGLMMAERRPPPDLLAVENYLRSAPLYEDQRDYAIGDIHKARPPRMPKPLSNKLVIPQCDELPGYQRTKIMSRMDNPSWSLRLERNGRRYPDYARPGRDTRAEIREAWKKKEKTEVANSSIYGVAKYDSRALTPGTNPDCNGPIPCMHVYGPNATRDGKVIDASKTLATITSTGDGGMNQSSADNWNTTGVTTTTFGPTFTSVPGTPGVGLSSNSAISSNVSAATLQAAATINPNVPYTQLMTDQWQRAGCNVKFDNYNPKACNTV